MTIYNGRPRSFGDMFPGISKENTEILEHIETMVANTVMSRAKLASQLADPRRDLDAECGYPKGPISPEFYHNLYERDAIAARVVGVYPDECWQVQPTVYSDESSSNTSTFEMAWKDIGKGLAGEPSYQREEKGSPIWEYLKRADELSGIGRYGIILLGVNDSSDYEKPLSFRPGENPTRKLKFIRCLPEMLAKINIYESDRFSPRYNQPVQYQITLNDPRYGGTGEGAESTTVNVHWTRIVHIADNRDTSEVFGQPRMTAVLNRILDLQKLYGASGEGFWKGALPGIVLSTHPQLGGEVRVDRDAIRGELEQYMNGLQRYMALTGFNATSLAPQVVDPSPHINAYIDAICVRLGVPRRVFLGSERGELASSQDDATWNDRLRERHNNYLTPRLIVPFVDRLVNLGVLPVPPNGYVVAWPDLTSQSEEERATVGFKSAQALAQYVTGEVSRIVPPLEFLSYFMGVPEPVAVSMLANLGEVIVPSSATKGKADGASGFNSAVHNPKGIKGGLRTTS